MTLRLRVTRLRLRPWPLLSLEKKKKENNTYFFLIEMKNSTIAIATVTGILTVGIGYMFYFDYKRRNDPQFRKQLSKIYTIYNI